jgi:NAD(P)-dependent dehydrogenase (short-subunit alcohol dehydrogenase family)
MNGTTCLITGGNSGIGKAAAIQLAQNNNTVIIACRDKERGAAAVDEIQAAAHAGEVSMLHLDMSSQKSIRDAVALFSGSFKKLDVLIHNAADFDISRKKPVYSTEGIETVWATNHVGPVLLTDLLLPLIKAGNSGRIITIASKGLLLHPFLTINLENPEFRNQHYSVEKAYYQSKLAQVMYTYRLSDVLSGEHITVNCIRVTNVKIDIARYPALSNFKKLLYTVKSNFSITPDEMAKAYTALALDNKFNGITGHYFDEKLNNVASSAYSRREEHIRQLMKRTYDFIK